MIPIQPFLRQVFICRAVFILTGLLSAVFASGQYCAPTVNATGIYITQIKFDYTTAITGGQTYLTGSNGYSQTTASSSGTIKRYWGGGIWFNVQNVSASAKTFHLKVFGRCGDVLNVEPDSAAGARCCILPGLPASTPTQYRCGKAPLPSP